MFLKSALRLGVAAIASTCFAFGAAAFDVENMSDAEREAFGAEVRAYILENPSIIVEAYALYQQQQEEAQTASDADMIAAYSDQIFNASWDVAYGNPEGDIVMVEFSDYRCGYCKKAYPDVNALMEKDGNIKLIIKEFPILGDASVLAARFALATKYVVGEEEYKELHHALMAGPSDISEGYLRRLAKKLDIDADAVFAALDSEEVNTEIQTNYALAQQMQISGTPSFVMGDMLLRGYVPYDAMVELVAELRDE
ncbi:DsbA family protein [Celeribacter litoreus]|uniref:DsbA family protein n=1 Tax=Celeribacter litoreus TaxID=2876714 RepID=UPI001CCCE5F2|nr:DsbA family protein [Celeribacter litoreus]MCA0043628.1 DsbA family protein [Celeribacter litoreus]